MEGLVEPTLLWVKEEEEKLEIKEEEEELEIKKEEEDVEIKEEEQELCIKQEGNDDEGSGSSRAFRSPEKRKRTQKLHRRLSLVNGLISESLLLLGKTPGRHSAHRRNAVRHLDSFDQTKTTLLLHATQSLLHSISCDLNVISRDSCDSTC